MAKKKPGRKGTSSRSALARVSKPVKPGTVRPAAVKKRTALEQMHQLGSITDRELWAGERFDRGYRVSLGDTAAQIPDFDPWRVRGGVATAEQLRAVLDQDGVGRDFTDACKAMDEADLARDRASKGITKRIVTAVACEERSCGELDRVAKKGNGWAAEILKGGLRIYVEMFGGHFKREVPGYLRGVGAR